MIKRRPKVETIWCIWLKDFKIRCVSSNIFLSQFHFSFSKIFSIPLNDLSPQDPSLHLPPLASAVSSWFPTERHHAGITDSGSFVTSGPSPFRTTSVRVGPAPCKSSASCANVSGKAWWRHLQWHRGTRSRTTISCYSLTEYRKTFNYTWHIDYCPTVTLPILFFIFLTNYNKTSNQQTYAKIQIHKSKCSNLHEKKQNKTCSKLHTWCLLKVFFNIYVFYKVLNKGVLKPSHCRHYSFFKVWHHFSSPAYNFLSNGVFYPPKTMLK